MKSAYIEDEEIVEESLPSRERGLKFLGSAVDWLADIVAPFAGAWIEIFNIDNVLKWRDVAPFAGAWIEIFNIDNVLKWRDVAPFAGAWIEIINRIGFVILIGVAPFAGAWIEIKKR